LKCALCNREAVKNSYCDLHAEAGENVLKTYDAWRKALDISWKEYLREIVKNPLTGQWAKEVAEYLIKSGERECGT
jgi:3-methyladenine DNA glycosylase AlkC